MWYKEHRGRRFHPLWYIYLFPRHDGSDGKHIHPASTWIITLAGLHFFSPPYISNPKDDDQVSHCLRAGDSMFTQFAPEAKSETEEIEQCCQESILLETCID